MKRFHVHVTVNDLEESVRFYSTVFAAAPCVVKDDYAKWMLEDPRINFAISNRGPSAGVNHLGFEVDSTEELRRTRDQLEAADSRLVDPSEAYSGARATGDLAAAQSLLGHAALPSEDLTAEHLRQLWFVMQAL
jgi:catechol 2,3-dioxygenase-like lactoylglutathione lyase family enzyme